MGGWHTNWIEISGFLTGALCVWLLVKENIWNWPVGIANNIFYILVFWRSGLFADASLQFVYISIALYGWWNWLHGGKNRSELGLAHASLPGVMRYAVMAGAATAVLYLILRRYTPSTVPLADGLTTALFLTAQYMMSRKLIENWWFWIAGDVLVIGLYIYKDLFLTAVLYVVFLTMCVMGLKQWERAAKTSAAAAAG